MLAAASSSSSPAHHFLLDDVLALLDHIIEDFLERGQVIVISYHGQFADQSRIMVLLWLFIPDLRLKVC